MYTQYREYMSMLSSAERGDLIMAVLEYAEEGSHSVELTSMASLLFAVIRNQMDMDGEKYSARCEQMKDNGKKGGSPKRNSTDKTEELDDEDKNQKVFYENQKNQLVFSETKGVNDENQKNQKVFSKTKQKLNDNENENDNEYENDNENVSLLCQSR